METLKSNLEVTQTPNTNYPTDYTSLIEYIGFSKTTWIIFSVANLLQFIWGCEVCMIAIYFENMGKYLNIKQTHISLSICLLYSMLGFGSLMVGYISKHFARKKFLIISTLIYLIFTAACSLFNDFYLIIFFRCISNASIGIFNILVLNLLCEFLPLVNRSFYLMTDSGFYNVGTLWTILIKMYVNDNSQFSMENFKIVNVLTCLPSLLGVFIIAWKTSESPLYMMAKSNDYDGAFKLLNEMSKEKQFVLTDKLKSDIKKDIQNKKNFSLKSDYKELFFPEYRWLTVLCLIINSICYLNMIGISYLVPKTIHQLKQTQIISENTQLIIFAIIQLPNGPVGGLMTESKLFGRKKTIIISSIFCAIFYVLIYINCSNLCYYAGIIMFFNSIAFGCSFVYVSEVFPTNIRDQAQSFIQFWSFLLGSWSPFFIDYVSIIDILSNNLYFGGTCILCGIIAIILPLDTLNRPLDDDL